SIPLTFFWGIIGTALGTLIANLYNWFITLRRIGGHMDLPASKVLPFNFYLKVLGTAILVALPVWVSRVYLFGGQQTLLGLAWSIPAYLILFGAAGSAFGIITSREWEQLRSWLSLKFLRS